MSNNHPSDLLYTETHEWIREEGGNTYTVGITDHAQGMLGDIVFVDVPELDIDVSANDEVAVVESVKTAADIYTPLSGRIVAVNEQLAATPDVINRDPYGDGWIFRIEVENQKELEDLLSADDYENTIAE